ncbi:hypothetical protein [Streptomyces avermitilis]
MSRPRTTPVAEDLAVAVIDELENPGPERLITVVHRDERPSA